MRDTRAALAEVEQVYVEKYGVGAGFLAKEYGLSRWTSEVYAGVVQRGWFFIGRSGGAVLG